jgi:predicted transcriptional regulator
MKQTPCEFIMWNLHPAIRHGIARSMVNDFGLTQKEAAEKLGITPAAISQYFSDKRGNIKIVDEKIISEIKISAENIIKNENIGLINETCRLCKLIKSEGLSPFFNSKNMDSAGNLVLCKF